ncbi:MAG: GcrA family cell cycle regulator [Alphaproteobacteria bacterium]
MEWSEENIARLTQMWQNGFTARQIAQKLGQGATRNSVIGKAHRMGLSQRPQTAQKTNRPAPVNLGMLKSCEFSYQDPRDKDFVFCGKPVKTGRPYCEEHCAITYRTVLVEVKTGKKVAIAQHKAKAGESAKMVDSYELETADNAD